MQKIQVDWVQNKLFQQVDFDCVQKVFREACFADDQVIWTNVVHVQNIKLFQWAKDQAFSAIWAEQQNIQSESRVENQWVDHVQECILTDFKNVSFPRSDRK